MTTQPYIPLEELEAARREVVDRAALPRDLPPSSVVLTRRSPLPPSAGRYEFVDPEYTESRRGPSLRAPAASSPCATTSSSPCARPSQRRTR